MSVQLFPFQREAVEAVAHDWAAGFRAVLVSLPTGAGKTIVASEVARQYAKRTGEKVLFLVPSDEILAQTLEKLALVSEGAPVGVVQQGRVELDRDMIVASVWTIIRHRTQIPRVGLIVTDEAHHAEAQSWLDLYDAVRVKHPAFLHLGLTATPFRQDKRGQPRGLSGIFERLSYSRSMFELIAAGYLVHLRGICIATGAGLDGVRVHGEDFEETALARVVNTPARNRLVVESYREYGAGRKAICFAVDVAHVQALTEEFCRQGVAAVALLGDTRVDERRRVRRRFRDGDLTLLCTCGVVNEGYDEPSAAVAILARPTNSRRLYVQQVGRVARRWPGKTEGLILDLVDATQHHTPVSMQELLAFYGLRQAEVQLTETTPQPTGSRTLREYHLTAKTITQILSVAELSPIVREVDIFRLDAFAWYQAHDGSAYVVSLYDGVTLGVVATGAADLFEVVATFREGVCARLLSQPTSLEIALGCANAYVFDFGDWRLAARRAGWRTAEPTPGQRACLRRTWYERRAEMARVVGFADGIQNRGEASGAISTLTLLKTLREGRQESREWALARFRERYGGARHSPRLLAVEGEQDSPVAATLRRYYVDLLQTARGTFGNFLWRTLDRCTLRVHGTQLVIEGGARTAAYTESQWTTIREVLARELGRVGEVEVVVLPASHAHTHTRRTEGGLHACTWH